MEQSYGSARQALEQVEEIRSQVARLRRGVEWLQARCTSTTSRYGYRAGGSGGDSSGLLNQLCDRRSELEEQERQLKEQEARITAWIDLLPRPRWRMVLRYRYLDGMELSEVAQELTRATGREFSVYQIYRRHREALQAAERLWPLH